VLERFPKLEKVLTKYEIQFVMDVCANPGRKHPGECSHFEDDGSEFGIIINHWEAPEKLGVVKCVGSYKWIPTEKLEEYL